MSYTSNNTLAPSIKVVLAKTKNKDRKKIRDRKENRKKKIDKTI